MALRAGFNGTVGQPSAQVIDGSFIFDKDLNGYFERTPGSAGNRRTWTWSGWVKKYKDGIERVIFNVHDSGNNYTRIRYVNTDQFQVYMRIGSGTNYYARIPEKHRDGGNGWYHLVVSVDTTQSTATDRIKLYVNGELKDKDTDIAPQQNDETAVNSTIKHAIGSDYGSDEWDGSMSNVYLIDGQALGPGYFGFTDPLTNTWRPKKYTGTYGTNGFYLPMDGNSPIGQDKSGNGNDFTAVNLGGSVALDNPQVSGARPILNTLPGGTQAGVGVFGSKEGFYETVSSSSGGGNPYIFDGRGTQPTLSFIRGATYVFDYSSATSHPLRFSTTSNGTHGGGSEYTDGTSVSGNVISFTVPHNAPDTLYYYCTNHSGMGNSISVTTDETKADPYAWKNVLALPLVGSSADVSNQINSGSTAKSVTENGPVYSSVYNNLYSGSYFFDGSNDELTIADSADWDIGSGDFTIEFWMYQLSITNTSAQLINQWGATGSSGTWYINASNITTVYAAFRSNSNLGSSDPSTFVTGTIKDNKWQHIAISRDGTNLRLFVDGVLQDTSTMNFTVANAVEPLRVGRQGYTGYRNGEPYNGYIQDVRFYKGVAKYTTDFVIPSINPDILPDTPSGVVGDSKLAKIDDTNGGTVASGTAGDKLTLSASSDFAFGTGDFTMECFAYRDSDPYSYSRLIHFGPYWQNNDAVSITFDDGDNANKIVFASYKLRSTGSVPSNGRILVSSSTVGSNRWYHVAVTRESGVFKLWIDGKLEDTESSVTSQSIESSATNTLAIFSTVDRDVQEPFVGKISNVRIVKGTAVYTSEFTPPSSPLTDVTNTKLLCCQSNTSATEAAVTPGTITANGNATVTDFTPFNTDINTVRGQETGYCTLNPLFTGQSSPSLSNGNLTYSHSQGIILGTMPFGTTGKWFFEVEMINTNAGIGIALKEAPAAQYIGYDTNSWTYYSNGNGASGGKYTNYVSHSTITSYGAGYTAGDVIGVALDRDTGELSYYKNGVYQGVAFTGFDDGKDYFPAVGSGNLSVNVNFGQKPFKFPPPDGFQPLNSVNIRPETIVARPDQYVGVTTYTGNAPPGSTNTQSFNIGFKPDLLWFKVRTATSNNFLFDTVRTRDKVSFSNTAANDSNCDSGKDLVSFDYNGFTVGEGNQTGANEDGEDIVAWAWKAGGNSNTYNVDDVGYATAAAAGLDGGTITPTGASIGTKQGFSIIAYTGNGSNSTISHGLTKKPQFILAKNRDSNFYYHVYHAGIGYTKYAEIYESLGYFQTNAAYWTAEPTSSVFSIGIANALNKTDDKIISYLWHDVPGLQKFGIYEGNADTDGPYVELGFKPAILMLKNADAAEHWYVYDSERSSYNPAYQRLLWSSDAVEENSNVNARVDLLSSGFKLRQTNAPNTANTYIYAAWAKTPAINLYGATSNAR